MFSVRACGVHCTRSFLINYTPIIPLSCMIHPYSHTYQGMDPGLSALPCPASPLYTEQKVGASVY